MKRYFQNTETQIQIPELTTSIGLMNSVSELDFIVIVEVNLDYFQFKFYLDLDLLKLCMVSHHQGSVFHGEIDLPSGGGILLLIFGFIPEFTSKLIPGLNPATNATSSPFFDSFLKAFW